MKASTAALPEPLSRRRFLGKMGGVANCIFAAHVVDGCVVAEVAPQATGVYDFSIAEFKDLAKVNGMAGLQIGDRLILLIRADDNTVLAFDNVCPHADLPMAPGVSTWDGAKLTCQYHESAFGKDGAYLGGAVIPWAGPEQGLSTFPVTFDAAAGTGTVTVGGE